MAIVALRPVEDGDLDAVFEQMRDPQGVRQEPFLHRSPPSEQVMTGIVDEISPLVRSQHPD